VIPSARADLQRDTGGHHGYEENQGDKAQDRAHENEDDGADQDQALTVNSSSA